MKAVIMAGGFGTRLRPLTYNLPKPMAPVFNKPMMEHIILLLKEYGIQDIIALLYFQPHHITDYFGDGKKWKVNIRYVSAEADFGTAGSVKNAEEFLDERFIIISGDVLTDYHLDHLLKFHEERGAEATIALSRQTNPLQFGIVMTKEDGQIDRFLEKPTWGQVFSDTINTGIYVLEPSVLHRIPPKEEFDFSKDLFPAMLRAQAPLFGHISENYWKDVGNLNEYLLANFDALSGKVKLHLPDYSFSDGIWKHETAEIAEGAIIKAPALIGPDVRIKEGAVIQNSILGAGCIIHQNARIQDSILWDNVSIGENTSTHKDVIGYRTRIDPDVYVSDNCFISDDVYIGKGATVKANIKIWPKKEIEAGATLTTSLIMGDRWLRELFTESKVSGLVNSEISPEFASKLGAALGAMVGIGKTVLVARDSSPPSRMINRGIINGLMSTGIQVFDLRNMPIPIVRHQLHSFSASAGVVTRLSPRQQETVEVIFLDGDGTDFPVKKRKSMERLFFGEDFFRAPSHQIGQIDFPIRVTEQYRFNFLNQIDAEAIRRRSPKIVVDFSFGGASSILPAILGRLSVQVVGLNAFLEGHRLEQDPESTQKSINEVQNIVPTVNADVGFILNASAEKIWVIDDKGNLIDHQKLVLLVVRLALELYKYDKIAVPVDTCIHVEEICSRHNCHIMYTSSDHQGLMDAVLNREIQFAAGTRGGFIFRNFHFSSDGMYNIARILEMLALSNRTLSELVKELPGIHVRKTAVPCPWDRKGQVMRQIMKHSEGKKRLLIDGVRLQLNEGTVLFLPDKEKAYFYVQTDSATPEKSEQLMMKYVELVNRWKT
ncbi:MAG: nucleotidyltransferase [Calditrichaeota bacterium]|nr:NTP transferase domain-containing protein [Calditrichota bacterium]RQW02260.1 MAG: nucleotidyltransferase [Calditrichota bacterium]